MKLRYLFTALISFLSLTSCAQNSESVQIKVDYEVVVSNLNIPWGFTFLPDNSMLITEKDGKLIHFKNGTKTNIDGLPEIYVRGQGGLMDIQLHPDYKTNGWIYFTYASPEGEDNGGNTALMRAKIKNNTLIEKQVLCKATPNTTRGQHFGSRIAFDKKGYIFFSIGERGDRDTNPQDITRDCGKIYRLHDDGSIPSDNPFVNVANAKKAIYAFGVRNPQGLVLNPNTGEIWEHEHGPSPSRPTKNTSQTAKVDSIAISSTIGMASSQMARESGRRV
jgi:glucose/arabinose dehydrogenase